MKETLYTLIPVLSVMVGLALSTAPAPVPAATHTIQDLFNEGMHAFRQGDYRQALARFEAAKRAGLGTPALHYNIGVCHYRLGDYGRARAAFEKAAHHRPLAALAHYNLGLVALKEGDRGRALAWFERAGRETEDPKLKRLTADRTAALAVEAQPRWSAVASANVGYDDNVLPPDDLSATGKGDGFIEAFAAANTRLAGSAEESWDLDLSAYLLDYGDVNAYDVTAFRGGVHRRGRLNEASSWRAGVAVDRSYLDGEGYQRNLYLDAGGRTQLGDRLALRLRYRYTHVAADSDFDYLDGHRNEGEAEAYYTAGKVRWHAGYRLEFNDRTDARSAATFTSYSPTRHTLLLGAALPLDGGWRGEGEVRYRQSRYDEADRLSDGSRVRREDERMETVLRLRRNLTANWELAAEYTYTDNRSNIDLYDYRRNLVTVGASWLY